MHDNFFQQCKATDDQRDDKLFFCAGDVSGKGVPASLVMAVTRSMFRNISSHYSSSPDQIIQAIQYQ